MFESGSPLLLCSLLMAAASSLCLGQVDVVCNDSLLNQCDLCITRSPQCSWCPLLPQENERLLKLFPEYQNVRCRDSSIFPMSCSNSSSLHGPEQVVSSSLDKTQNDPLSQNALETPLNQVTPQNVVIRLRQGDTKTFNMTFISLRNTPLDVYFLADVSGSLSNTIESLREDIVTIATELEKISAGFAIGFGSFVDKNSLPYAHNNYEQYTNEFRNETTCRNFAECVPTYSFHHSIQLTNNVSHFEDILPNVSRISSSLDDPEGGLDALLQVALCSEEIGWRNDALKMVFLVTDQNYHLAGDGKLAGIVQPHDGKCNLAKVSDNEFEEYEYTGALNQDYVSIWQIRDALQRNRIVPTFVLQYDGRFGDPPRRLVDAYETLRASLSLVSAQVLALDSQSTASATRDLISIIQTAYNRTVQEVSVAQPNGAEGYQFSITPVLGCDSKNNKTGACAVDFGNTVKFSVSVTLKECTKAKEMRINLAGGPYQFTTVDLEPLCSCPCSEPEQQIKNSSVCTMGQGDQVCGVCECTDPFSGPECQCEVLGVCQNSNDCNGYECDVCGNCICNGTAFGEMCECDRLENFCPRSRNPDTGPEQVCSGRGECVCESNTCDCETAPMSGLKYFGRGTMFTNDVDGGCECNPDDCYNPDFPMGLCYSQGDRSYNNDLCACDGCSCPPQLLNYENTCIQLGTLCDELDDCVHCFLKDPCSQQPCSVSSDCSNFCVNHTFQQLEVEQFVPDSYSFDTCELVFDGCTVEFYFSSNKLNPILISNAADYDCLTLALPWIIAASAVALILLIGILTLIFLKLCLVILDRIEYKRFLREMQRANFARHENPLYITPKREYENPLRRVHVPNSYTQSTVKHTVANRP